MKNLTKKIERIREQVVVKEQQAKAKKAQYEKAMKAAAIENQAAEKEQIKTVALKYLRESTAILREMEMLLEEGVGLIRKQENQPLSQRFYVDYFETTIRLRPFFYLSLALVLTTWIVFSTSSNTPNLKFGFAIVFGVILVILAYLWKTGDFKTRLQFCCENLANLNKGEWFDTRFYDGDFDKIAFIAETLPRLEKFIFDMTAEYKAKANIYIVALALFVAMAGGLAYIRYIKHSIEEPYVFVVLILSALPLMAYSVFSRLLHFDRAHYLYLAAANVLQKQAEIHDKQQTEFVNSMHPKPENDDAYFMTSEQIGAAGLLKEVGIPLGQTLDGQPIHYNGGLHLMTIAPSGTGKHSCVQGGVLIEYDASIIIIDPKGENAAVTAKSRRDILGYEVHIINPFGVLNDHFAATGFSSSRFNPLAALDLSGSNFVADISALCEALILTEGKDPYFDNSARDLVACLIMHVCTEPNETRTLPRVRQLLTSPPKDFEILLEFMGDSDFAPLAQKARVFLKDTKGNDAIISTARTQTSFLDDPCLSDNLSGSDFRFLDLKSQKITVYIVLPAKMVFTYSRWFRLLVTAGLDELMSTEKRREKPVLFILDEAPILGHLSSIETAFGLSRGFGVQLWPFFQDINQLNGIYKERANSFFSNSGVHQFFTPNDLKTADYLSERCGEVTDTVTSTSYSEHLSSTDAERKTPLYSAHNLLSMPDDKQLLFLAKHSNPIKAAKERYFKKPKYKGKYDKNPYV